MSWDCRILACEKPEHFCMDYWSSENDSMERYTEYDVNWLDKTFDSAEEAEKFLEDRPAGRNIAVKVQEGKPTKTLFTLSERADRLAREYKAMVTDMSFLKQRTSKHVMCRNCGSSLSIKYIKTPKCPVCGEDLHSKTDQDRIEAKRKAASKAAKQLAEEEKKVKCRAKPYWLVIGWIHS